MLFITFSLVFLFMPDVVHLSSTVDVDLLVKSIVAKCTTKVTFGGIVYSKLLTMCRAADLRRYFSHLLDKRIEMDAARHKAALVASSLASVTSLINSHIALGNEFNFSGSPDIGGVPIPHMDLNNNGNNYLPVVVIPVFVRWFDDFAGLSDEDFYSSGGGRYPFHS